MKIYDCFQFAGPREADVMWLKMSMEESYVDKWIITENEYTHQGEHKGLHAEEVIYGQSRFKEFRDRIEVITDSFEPEPIYKKEGVYDDVGYKAEIKQRGLARNILEDELDDGDWVLLSDCDECLDFDSKNRARIVKNKIDAYKSRGIIQIPRLRYWFDYDMMWPVKRSVPVISGEYLRGNNEYIADIRSSNIGKISKWEDEIIFEYSFCYSNSGIEENYNQTYHTGYDKEDIKSGIKCGHVPVSNIRGTSLSSRPEVWLERVMLGPQNSPLKVRENIELLKTHVIPEKYIENRKQEYPNMWKSKVWKSIYYSRLKYRMIMWRMEKAKDRYLR